LPPNISKSFFSLYHKHYMNAFFQTKTPKPSFYFNNMTLTPGLCWGYYLTR
jgi:hypothetical protein